MDRAKFLAVVAMLMITSVVFSQSRKKMSHRDSVLAEYHISQGDPFIEEEPALELSKELRGWTLSLDQKWLETEQKLPLYGLSTNSKLYNSNEAELGEDNVTHMAFYNMKIDDKDYLIYTKQYKTGYYKYPITKKGWKTQNNFYYCIVGRPEELMAIKDMELDTNYNFGFKIVNEGLFPNVGAGAYKKPLKMISETLYLEKTARKLVVQMEKKENDQLRLLIYAIHPVFDDPSGLAKDRLVRNKSIYSAKETLDQLHYTVLTEEWSETILP